MRKKQEKERVGIIIFLVLLTIIFILFPNKQLTITPEEIEHHAGDILYDSISLSQKIKVPENYEGIVFYVGTYMKVLEKGTINIEIIDSTAKTVYKKNIDIRTIVDSAAVYLNTSLKKGESYTIKIKTDQIKKNMPITLYKIDTKNEEYRVYKNGKIEKDSLDIRYYNYKNSYLNIWYIMLLVPIIYLYNCLHIKGGKIK